MTAQDLDPLSRGVGANLAYRDGLREEKRLGEALYTQTLSRMD